jgi:CysZ protein
MLDAAFKALAQMFSPPFRKILLKSAGMALLLIIVAAIGLHRVLVWFAEDGQTWLQTTLGLTSTTPLTILSWVLSIAAALGIVAGSIFLMPTVTSLLASFFADEVAEQVERRHYPGDPPGHALPILPAAFRCSSIWWRCRRCCWPASAS